jgi:hypothetical protein
MVIFIKYSYEEAMKEYTNKWNLLFDDLPDDIKEYIYDNFLDRKCLMFLNKENYKKYHHQLINYIPAHHYMYYVKDITENNMGFVFTHLLDEMFKTWMKMKNISYNQKVYKNFISLIVNEFCKYNDNDTIVQIINNKFNSLNKNMRCFI